MTNLTWTYFESDELGGGEYWEAQGKELSYQVVRYGRFGFRLIGWNPRTKDLGADLCVNCDSFEAADQCAFYWGEK